MSTAVNRAVSASITVERELAHVAEALRKATVQLRGAGGSAGSGVIWRSDGLIITNAHVVARQLRMNAVLADGRTLKAYVAAHDPRHDLAALRGDAFGLDQVRVRDLNTLRAGEVVFAVGNPMGVPGAVASGILHAVPGKRSSWIEADIALAPGNSGGPLADAEGRLIGINSMIVNGMGLAVSANEIERFLREAGILMGTPEASIA